MNAYAPILMVEEIFIIGVFVWAVKQRQTAWAIVDLLTGIAILAVLLTSPP
jgi:hypothetical protein